MRKQTLSLFILLAISIGIQDTQAVEGCCPIGYYGASCQNYFVPTNNLIHYWPFNGDFKDVMSGADFFPDDSVQYVQDRNNISSFAIYLNNQNIEAPARAYLNGDFTISVWVNVAQFDSLSRLIDFGTVGSNEVFLGYSVSRRGFPFIGIFSNNFFDGTHVSNIEIFENQWNHLVFTLKGDELSIYVNAALVHQRQAFSYNVTIQGILHLGENLFCHQKYANTYVDELRIFNKALNQTEIVLENILGCQSPDVTTVQSSSVQSSVQTTSVIEQLTSLLTSVNPSVSYADLIASVNILKRFFTNVDLQPDLIAKLTEVETRINQLILAQSSTTLISN